VQTYTQILIGGAVGAIMFPNNTLAHCACAAGGAAPDLVMIPKFALDKLREVQPFAKQSKAMLFAKEPPHSIVLWVVLIIIGIIYLPQTALGTATLAFCIGALSHVIGDIPTHADPRFADTEPTFCWPLKVKLSQIFGIWDYRIDHGLLWPPKPTEIIIIGISIITIIIIKFL